MIFLVIYLNSSPIFNPWTSIPLRTNYTLVGVQEGLSIEPSSKRGWNLATI